PAVPAVASSNPMTFAPPPGNAPVPPGAPHQPEGDDVRPSLWSADRHTNPSSDFLATEVHQRVIARIEEWIATDLDDRVLQLVERRMNEETERRAWRLGTEVF
ncbi:MAG: hypothetical protein M3Y20_03715, partial [Actinomycetota bacterium]|nr:hypothetical protein [Actinomycetota bacterium]